MSSNKVASVLDFGCGVGRHIRRLSRDKRLAIFGYDQSDSMIAGAKSWLTESAASIVLRSGAATGKLPFNTKSIDVSFTSEVLLHSRPEDISQILEELCRVTRRFVFHLEPHEDFPLEANTHAGCWYHDIVTAYAGIGIAATRLGRTCHAQELVVADLDGTFEAADSMLQLLNEAEVTLQPTLELSRHLRPIDKLVGEDNTDCEWHEQGWPIPYLLYGPVPLVIEPAASASTEEEIRHADSIRKPFFLPDGAGAYMVDIARAFRIARGAEVYVEVGSRDKGNIAFVSQFLAPNALIIDIDTEHVPAATERIKKFLPNSMSYEQISGDSVSQETFHKLSEVLNGRRIDLAFVDSSHMFDHFIKEFNIYFPRLRTNGVLLIHDIFWEGNERDKGKAQALEIIDRFHPVYAIHENRPVHRFARLSSKKDSWGGVGLIVRGP